MAQSIQCPTIFNQVPLLPPAKELIKLALKKIPNANVNTLHQETYRLILKYRSKYYDSEVDAFLEKLDVSEEQKNMIKKELLKPVNNYSNIIEKIARRASQSLQPISGSVAQLCVERELVKAGLKEGIHFVKGQRKQTDILICYPDIKVAKIKHRIEIKNVSMRERAVRGLGFDGDSLFGFFNQPREFTKETIEIIDEICKEHDGYCYVPPATLDQIVSKGYRLRPNTQFGKDMVNFVKQGKFP